MRPKRHSLVEGFEALPGAPGVSHFWKDQWKANGPQGWLKSRGEGLTPRKRQHHGGGGLPLSSWRTIEGELQGGL